MAALENRDQDEPLSLTRLRAVGAPMPAVIPTRYQLGEAVLSFFTTITRFGATGDIAMSELRIEMFFPGDDAPRQAMEAIREILRPAIETCRHCAML